MSRKYRLGADRHAHFVTFTIKHYQENNGLEAYAWCIMTSHIHLILRSESSDQLSATIKNLKGYTARTFHKMLLSEHPNYESRKRWLLWMKQSGNYTSNTKGFQFWQQHNQPIELWSDEVFYQKIDYIHLNPVKEGFVRQPEDWL